MGIQALISLGSNLGDRRARLDFAVERLRHTPGIQVQTVSRYRETLPVGGPQGQGQFLNAAAALEIELEPFDLLRVLQGIENQAGRVRTARWAERSLDLDLLYFGDRVISNDLLQIPHPRAAVRRFVLGPLAEIAPTFVDPLTDRTVASLLANLDTRPSVLAFSDPSWPMGQVLLQRLAAKSGWMLLPQHAEICKIWEQVGERGSSPITGEQGERVFEWLGSLMNPNAESPPSPTLPRRKTVPCPPLVRGGWGGSEASQADPWFVSDLWLDAWYRRLPIAEADREWFRERSLELRGRIVSPTFVVAPAGEARRFSRLQRDERWQPPLGDVPILEIDPEDLERGESEVVAACAATRVR